MVKHIVLFNFKEGVDKDQAAAVAMNALEPLKDKIPGVITLEARRTFAGADLALYSEFESREAAAFYADHPLHAEAKSKFFPWLESRVAADYEI